MPHEDRFWHPKTADELAAEQGVVSPQSLDELTGAAADLWENDEEFEQFLASIDRHPREPAKA